jgi:topoisomerase-4 subunit A
LSASLNPPPGATWAGVMMGAPEDLYLLASDAGYGLVAKLRDFVSDRRAGKAVLKVPEGARVMAPRRVTSYENDWVVVVTNTGRMLVFALGDLPQMEKGKGEKLFGIPGAKVKSREEYLAGIAVIPENGSVRVLTSDKELVMKQAQIDKFIGEKGLRGSKLPRGYQEVKGVERVD